MALFNAAAFSDEGQSCKQGKMKGLYLLGNHLSCDVNKSLKMRWMAEKGRPVKKWKPMFTLPWSYKVPSTCSTHLIDPTADRWPNFLANFSANVVAMATDGAQHFSSCR
jgi:hypothetical protein